MMLAEGRRTPAEGRRTPLPPPQATSGGKKAEPDSCPPSGPLDHARRHRTAFTHEQLCRLEQEYGKESYVSRPRRCELAAALNLPETTIKVWFQNRRMKDKRQRLSLPWPHPLIDPLGALLIGRASSPSTLPYPFVPPHLPHLPHLSVHHYSSMALSSPASSAHGLYSAPVRPLDALHFSQLHCRPPPAGALFAATGAAHHAASCPCRLCLHWRPERLLKAAGEGLSRRHSPNRKSGALERREELV